MLKIQEIFPYKEKNKNYKLPLYNSTVKAGFASPAESYIQARFSLDDIFIKNPSTTYLVRVSGESMKDINILDEDILIVDSSLTPRNESIVIASIDGEFLVKQYILRGNKAYLVSANSEYEPIALSTEQDNICWGVVIFAVHNFL